MEASGDVLGGEEKNKFFDQSCPEIGSAPNPDEECGSCFLLISQELFT